VNRAVTGLHCRPLLAVLLLFLGGAGVGSAANGRFNIDIVAIALSGRQTNVTHNSALDLNPAVARDGRIVFLSTRGGNPDLYVMSGDGRNVRRLTHSAVDHTGVAAAEDLEFTQAAWSPRGDKVAFDGKYLAAPADCEQHCASWDVMVVGSDGSGLEQVALGARAPAWSPDGRRLGYEAGVDGYFEAGGIAIARSDGSGSLRVTGINPVSAVGPVWSPSGREIAFQAQGWIYRVRADGQRKRRLAAGQSPTWSRDGRRLAFIDDHKLFTIDRNGKGKRRVSRAGEFVYGAAWSPKRMALGYVAGATAEPSDGFRVETVSGDGTQVHVLAREPVGRDVWGSPVWTQDGRRLLVAVETQ
jgi:Tol biopolymer transport system component